VLKLQLQRQKAVLQMQEGEVIRRLRGQARAHAEAIRSKETKEGSKDNRRPTCNKQQKGGDRESW